MMNREAVIGGVDAPARWSAEAAHSGALIVNADDWGRDRENTDSTLECVLHGAVSSVSAMVFMEDSERAATIALEKGIDAGLHLNFTTGFSAPGTSGRLIEHQTRIGSYVKRHRLAQVVYHPGLAGSFQYVVAAQLDEFFRLFGFAPKRIDGHHHMHLCANVLQKNLLPAGTTVRRNFSFQPGEKSYANRVYRRIIDRKLAKRHSLTDYFYSLPPLEPTSRLVRIFSLAKKFKVEVETHPVVTEEYRFLMGEEMLRLSAAVRAQIADAS
jgi:predicted glycoside hydrolase/deacetylase ChbG (UPF0249 family)